MICSQTCNDTALNTTIKKKIHRALADILACLYKGLYKNQAWKTKQNRKAQIFVHFCLPKLLLWASRNPLPQMLLNLFWMHIYHFPYVVVGVLGYKNAFLK